jgi:hypothetical protein
MDHDVKLEFIIPNGHADHEVRADKLIETLVDQVLPKMAASLSLNEDEVFARLLIELGHIIGITHAPDSALSMIGMMTDAVLQGQQAALETGSPESEKQSPLLDENERLPDWAENCSPVRH